MTVLPGLLALTAAAALAFTLPRLDGETSRAKPVSFALLEDYDKGTPLAEIEADFALFQELEIGTWRGSFGWDDYEPERGTPDFAWLHAFAALAAREHITLRPYVGYTPDWAARVGGADEDVWNNPPERVADWERFATTLAREMRRHANVASFEIYNEENVLQWWDGTAEAYAGVLRAGARALRAGYPGVPVLFGGLVFPDTEWIERVCGAAGTRNSFDVLPFHAYPETWTPADVTVENYLGGLPGFVEAADARCGRKPIWINETGFATLPGKSERDQAYWWVRAVATFLAAPRVEHIGIYEIKDLPPDRPVIGDAPNYHLGITRIDRTKKLAFHTIDLLTDLLDVGSLRVEDDALTVRVVSGTPGDLHAHVFARPDGDRVLIVWDRTGSPTLELLLRNAPASMVEYDVDSRPLRWEPTAAPLANVQLAPGVPRIFRLASALPD